MFKVHCSLDFSNCSSPYRNLISVTINSIWKFSYMFLNVFNWISFIGFTGSRLDKLIHSLGFFFNTRQDEHGITLKQFSGAS